MSTMIEVPSKQEMQAPSQPVIAAARCLVVSDKPSHAVGLRLLQTLAGAERTVKAKLDPIVKAANDTHKALTGLRRELLEPIEEARAIVGSKVNGYEDAARRAAEDEAAAIAEAERKADENRRITAAVDAEASGDRAGAEAIMNEPAPEVVVTVQPEVAAVEGVGKTYEVWSAEVLDLAALVKHGQAELLLPNTVALNAMARAMKGGLKIPGVRAVCKTTRKVSSYAGA